MFWLANAGTRPPRRGLFGVAGVALLAGIATWAGLDLVAAPRPAYAMVTGEAVNAREAPSLASPVRYRLRPGARLEIACQRPGDRVAGLVRDTDQWDRLGDGRYVSDAFVHRFGPVPPGCAVTLRPGGPAPTGVAWVAPAYGVLTSGFRTAQRPGHNGVDVAVPRGTPVRAAAAGTVLTAQCAPATPDCDVDGSLLVAGCGWYVEVAHSGGLATRYCHLRQRPLVRPGEAVDAGQVLGYAGSSGNSDGPHLHLEVHTRVPPTPADAVDPVPFLAARGVALGPGP